MTYKLISADSSGAAGNPHRSQVRFVGHRRALSKGRLAGHVVECPLHFATFDVRTGKLLSGPASADVTTFAMQVKDDMVYVKRAASR